MLISVVTAVFNREATIQRALESLRTQSYDEVEHVVVDGASTDTSLAVIQGNPPRPPHQRIVRSEPDQGIYDALNKGIRLARGEVIGLLHSDDEFAGPRVLQRVAEVMQDSQVDLLFGDLDFFEAGSPSRVLRSWRSTDFERAALNRGWMPPHPTVFVRRSLFERFGLYDSSFRIAGDYEFLLRVLKDESVQVRRVPEVLYRLGIGGASTGSLRGILRKSREDLRAARMHGFQPLLTVALKNARKLHQLFPRSIVSTTST